MPIAWSTVEAKDHLFLATVAACDPKLDYRKIATFYGQGATYDAIEGQFRKIRNGAKELRAKVEAGEVPVAPPRGAKSNPNTPRKPSAAPRDKTIGGRISKSANATPTKKGKGTKEIKEETTESSASSFYESSAEDITNWNASQPVVESEEFNYYFPNGNMEEDL